MVLDLEYSNNNERNKKKESQLHSFFMKKADTKISDI
jgi:hypothetical protein